MKHVPLGAILLLFAVTACNRIKPEPPRRTASQEQLPLPLSTLVIPIYYHVDSLEATINNKVKGTFIQQWITLNDKGDSLYLEITRRGRVEIEWRQQTLYYSFPLRVSGKFIKRIAGVRVKNSEPVDTEMILNMATHMGFAKDWNLQPASELRDIVWIKDPTLKIAMVRVNLRKKVEQAILARREELTRKMDDVLKEKLATRAMIAKLWNDIQKPIRINRKGTQVWLKPHAHDLKARLTSERNFLALQVELNAYIRTVLEGDSIPASNSRLPGFKPKVSQTDSLEMFVLATVPFEKVNELLNAEMKDFKIEAEGYATTLKELEVYGTDGGLAVKLRLKGDVSGKVYLEGRPVYDTATGIFSVNNLRFHVDSESALVNSADWLLHDDALAFLNTKLQADPGPLIAQLPAIIENAVERGKSGEKINIVVNNLQVKPGKLIVTEKNIQVVLEARGAAAVGLEKKVFASKRPRKRKQL